MDENDYMKISISICIFGYFQIERKMSNIFKISYIRKTIILYFLFFYKNNYNIGINYTYLQLYHFLFNFPSSLILFIMNQFLIIFH